MMQSSTGTGKNRIGRTFAGAALLAVLLSAGLTAGVWAQAELPAVHIPTTGMKAGKLTDKHEKSAEISGTPYAFSPGVVFGDNEERPLEWKDFKKGDEVQFRLNKGQIDLLIKVLPQ